MKRGEEYKNKKTGVTVVIDECNDTRVKATANEMFFIGKEDMTIEEFNENYELIGEGK